MAEKAMRSQRSSTGGRHLLALALVLAGCADTAAAPDPAPAADSAAPSIIPVQSSPATDPATVVGASSTSTTRATSDQTSTSTSTLSTTAAWSTTSMAPERSTVVDADLLDDITMTSVPDDVIVPSDGDSLDEQTNPINGRRGGPRPADDDDVGCEIGLSEPCVTSALDMLGFDVTSGPTQGRERQVRRATAVVQLDAGLPETGSADAALLDYLGIATGDTTTHDTTTHDTTTHDTTTHDTTHDAAETRRIGVSAEGRPIMAMRYGDGPRTVLVVGQTHGDEEGGLRILLRARTLDVPDAVTLWVIPTMNPDGLIHDTRFLANGADPNRHAPSEPEQDAVYDFAMTIRPSLSVWYHQNYGWVGGSGASYAPAKEYQRLTGLGTLKRSGDCTVRGFMWCPIDAALGSSSILVELEDVLTPADVQIHARALLEVAAGPDP